MKIPGHLAIIMDGNGRWAESRGRERTFGHLRGARIARTTIERCAALGVQYLTLYAFSTENWFRPKREVAFLMGLLARHLRRERKTLLENNIRFSTVGTFERLPAAVQVEVERTITETRNNTGMNLIFALSYGSRQEITTAVQRIAAQIASGKLAADAVDEKMIASQLETAHMPDPDLIIRTSGEHRLSNFLLWQAAYSELYITDTLWPDFVDEELLQAFEFYSRRERRFGKTTAQLSGAERGSEPVEMLPSRMPLARPLP